VRGRPSVVLPDAVTTSLLRLATKISEVRRIHVTEVLCAGTASAALHGPIDALVPRATARQTPDGWPPGTIWTWHSVAAPHTRCNLAACLVETARSWTQNQVLDMLASAPRVLIATGRLGFSDTAVLAEFFRDLGRPAGEFIETVVFEETLQVTGHTICMWMAAHPKTVVAEIVDSIRALLGLAATPWESMETTDRALGLLRSLQPARA